MLANIGTVIICYPDFDVINFEINLSFVIKPFSYMTKKVRKKSFIIFKGLSLRLINQTFSEGESPTLKFIKLSNTNSCSNKGD